MGGLEPPYCPEKCAKYHVFSAFEADFCSNNENIPPMGLASRSCEGLAVKVVVKVCC